MTSKDELQEKIEAAIKDGLSNHTGEWFNSWIVPGLNLTEEQLRDLLFYLTKVKRLQDNILNLLEDEKQKATMPTHIMGRPIEEVITILNALELERIEDLKMTMSNLNEWMERVRDDHHRAMQKAIDNTFATLKKRDV